ncbi:sigma-54-dependent Fis family transcriptional regulator [Candidatus Saganbacteria bacterium]|nr:sigma-54-dependent Fis family transcriptional regulator [Candidatus Saganbacteria bacterium]
MNKKEKIATILIVDDEESIRDSMRILLSENYHVLFASDGRQAIEIVKNSPPDLMLLDIRLPEIDGIEVLKRVKDLEPDLDVIMVTAMNTVQYAVEAIKAGAYDYITKPFDIATISTLVEKITEKKALLKENLYLKEEIHKKFQFEKIIGNSPAMREIFSLISQISRNDSTILIQGESGTGKELVARAIHNTSGRVNKLFVPVNCAAIPENLLESELFGHEKGAFTGAFDRKLGKFEIAEGGTLFLDEIGSLPLSMQGKLLRALQEKEIERVGGSKPIPTDVRIISATNTDLNRAVLDDKFRKDLYYRLNVIPIIVPPLKDRREDITFLVEHFLSYYNNEFGKNIKGFSESAMGALYNYDWPGNVRELQNLVERVTALSKTDIIEVNRLPKEIVSRESDSVIDISSDLDFKKASMKFEAAFIKRVLEKAKGRKSKAAELMGIHRNTLLQIERKLKDRSS